MIHRSAVVVTGTTGRPLVYNFYASTIVMGDRQLCMPHVRPQHPPRIRIELQRQWIVTGAPGFLRICWNTFSGAPNNVGGVCASPTGHIRADAVYTLWTTTPADMCSSTPTFPALLPLLSGTPYYEAGTAWSPRTHNMADSKRTYSVWFRHFKNIEPVCFSKGAFNAADWPHLAPSSA